jgi:UDP-3-O-[3-hydroxymyristoyl] glucosamine N-acyltransferase
VEKSLKELAEYLEGRVIGDEQAMVSGLASLDEAGEGEITFLANPKYVAKVGTTRATAVILPPGAEGYGRNIIEVANPYLAFAKLLTLFHVRPAPSKGVMEGAFIGRNVVMGSGVTVFPGASVGDDVKMGDRVTLHPGVVVYDGVELGDDVTLHANVSVREKCRIGNRVLVHNGSVIGADGFGYVPDGTKWYKLPQIGIVVIEDDVEIGANVTIDRAALNVTLIRRGVKIDNLVQIAHNCEIGEDSAIAALAGIAGSAKFGKHVILGGHVGVAGHLEIGDNVTVAAMSGVHNNLAANQVYSGVPVLPHREWLKLSMTLPRVPEMRKTLHALEKRIAELEAKLKE